MTAFETTPPVDADSPRAGVTSPLRCTSCGHVTMPAIRCQCGHLDVFHAFNTANTARKACSRHDGARNTRCPCKAFTPELPKETSR